MRNKILRLSAAALFAAVSAFLIGCGGNSTPVGVTVAPVSPSVPLGGQLQFQAVVTGTSTTAVTWQICLVPSPTNAQPTICSPATTGQTQLPSGYGIITSGQTNTPQGGFYTAPTSLPPTNDFLVVATSIVNTKIFGVTVVHIDSTVRVAVSPQSATIAPGDTYTFTANVTGTTNTAVTWEVNGNAGGDVTDGFIVPGGGNGNTAVYTAPLSQPPGSVVISAVSAFDPLESGTAALTIISSTAPILTSASPNTVGEGSAQQEVFLSGSNFTSNSVVLVGTPPVPVPTIFLSTALLDAKIPAAPLSVAGPLALDRPGAEWRSIERSYRSNKRTEGDAIASRSSGISAGYHRPECRAGRRESHRGIFLAKHGCQLQRNRGRHAGSDDSYQQPAIGSRDSDDVRAGAGAVSADRAKYRCGAPESGAIRSEPDRRAAG